MKLVTQLSIFLKNKPGVLAEVSRALAAKDINILGISVSDTVDHAIAAGYLRLRAVICKPRKHPFHADQGSGRPRRSLPSFRFRVAVPSVSNSPPVTASTPSA